MKIGLILLAAGTVWAQQGSVAGPTSGFVFDRATSSLRPVLGLPGASTLGAPLAQNSKLAAAWVSPKLDYAIARASDGSLKMYRLDGSGTETGIDGVPAGPQNVTFSPSGASALVATSSGSFVLTGLPGNPRVAGTVDVPEHSRRNAPAGPSGRTAVARVSTAVSDDAVYVLVASGGTARVVTTSGENRRLADVTDAVVAFAPGSHDVSVADSASGVIVYRGLDSAPSPTVLAAQEDFGSPNGIAFSADGKRVFVSASKTRGVLSYDLASGAKTAIGCDCSPVSLLRMGDAFRLNELAGEPLWLLDATRAEARIVFVPALSN